ncbi:MAG: acetyl-CoA decarbonylase/synthase complex subunit delta, partial [Chloroflexota bacterium]
MPVTVEIPKEKWAGKVREVTLGAMAAEGGTRAKTVTVGGEATLPFLHFDGAIPHSPALAIEVRDRKPDDWAPLLQEAWGDAMNDPAEWARAAEKAGADLIVLTLSLTTADGKPNTPENARAVVRKVLNATGLPLAVFGPGQAEKDNELIVPVA